ncbi:MAG TPA: pyridoxal phosphate-dependent aminotransferase [Gammaproteobacteria bacterium]|nr:pyridoxal phosphate-dependent aminotransferase [Gammaproteobacteria bacterium]
MDIQLSDRVQRIKTSPTLAMATKAASLKKQGINIIDLSTGEPDFDTPEHIKQAAISAIHSGFTKYTAIGGVLELREVIAQKLNRDNQLSYAPNEILVSSGGKQSFYNLAAALLNAGDEVIIPAPYWVSFPDMVLLNDAKPVTVFAGIENNFKITPTQLKNAITPKTRLLILNSPCNPTGVAYTRQELAALGQVLTKHPQIIIATDDMYEKILWSPEPFCNILMACPDLYDRTLVLHGVSKTYAMTGWRIGFAAGPVKLIQAMATIQSQSTSNPCSISQMAAKAALEGDQTCVGIMVDAFKKRHDYFIPALNTIDGMECRLGDGAFYAFPKVEGLMKHLGLKDDLALADFLLTETAVAVVPGTPFGAPGYVRMSFATSLDNLQEAIRRFKAIEDKIDS